MRVLMPPYAMAKRTMNAKRSPRAAEGCYGTIQSVVASAQFCYVYVRGASVAQPAIYGKGYNAGTAPSVGDHVICLLIGTDSGPRAQYLVLDKIP